MRDEPRQDDLLAVLAGPDDETPVGTIRGPDWEGLAAGLEVWCGPVDGWRRFDGLLRPHASIMRHSHRLWASLSFDLGPASPFPLRVRPSPETEEGGADTETRTQR